VRTVSRFRIDPSHGVELNPPALHLFAEVIQDAVNLVRGARATQRHAPAKQVEVEAARTWIRNGNIGVLSLNDCCGYLGWDAEHVRQAIFSPPRAA